MRGNRSNRNNSTPAQIEIEKRRQEIRRKEPVGGWVNASHMRRLMEISRRKKEVQTKGEIDRVQEYDH